MTATIAPEPVSHTFASISIDSKEGQKFLRRVIRENESLNSDEQWTAHASRETDFTLEFYRRIRGSVGDAEQEIRVRTSTQFSLRYRPGNESYAGDSPVLLVECHRVYFGHTDTSTLCYFLKQHDGIRLSIEGHRGSTSTSKHGLSFYNVSAHWPALPKYTGIMIGQETIAINGRSVMSGSVDLHR